ncbi:hypothetical protein AGR7A_pAt20184 [Agrobacterium deltaense NCPPB 1641]|uniref:Uncharacterized protein n=1 Tax=Agrobacterium deltaense NCPPB 1641 TaxID=1183425 RepID=A0A1S7U8U2_9HYPH|nr:hypothetical protein AGR7A_pAt20184 [Agrobacterium deltaense NCPPB 1641]
MDSRLSTHSLAFHRAGIRLHPRTRALSSKNWVVLFVVFPARFSTENRTRSDEVLTIRITSKEDHRRSDAAGYQPPKTPTPAGKR